MDTTLWILLENPGSNLDQESLPPGHIADVIGRRGRLPYAGGGSIPNQYENMK